MIGRVATNNQAQILLAQLLQNESNLNKSQEQVASGKVAKQEIRALVSEKHGVAAGAGETTGVMARY